MGIYDYEYPEPLPDPSVLPLCPGMDYSVEDEADKILSADRREQRARGETPDYLTIDQIALRHNREVIGPYGAPDRAKTNGIYRRTYNPLMGQRPTKLRQGEDG